MKYPTKLPTEFQSAYDAERARAERELGIHEKAFAHAPGLWKFYNALDLQALIIRVFFAYCTQALSACRAKRWSLDQMEKAVNSAFARICDGYSVRERGVRSKTTKARLRSVLWPEVSRYPQWRHYLAEKAMLAESLANNAPKPEPKPKKRGRRPSKFTDKVKAKALAVKQAGETEVSGNTVSADNRRSADVGHKSAELVPAGNKRFPSTITSLIAAKRVTDYMQSKGYGQTQFAVEVGTTDRTIRNLSKTGKIRRGMLGEIAERMGTTLEALLKPE